MLNVILFLPKYFFFDEFNFFFSELFLLTHLLLLSFLSDFFIPSCVIVLIGVFFKIGFEFLLIGVTLNFVGDLFISFSNFLFNSE